MNELAVILGAAGVVVLVIIIAAWLVLRERQKSFLVVETMRFEFNEQLKVIQLKHEGSMKHQRTMQRAVHVGAAAEMFAPFLPDFPSNHTEARHLGSPIDYVCFCGMENPDEEITVVFVEVKSGRTNMLTERESRVRDAIESGRVRWQLYKVPQPRIRDVQ